MNEQSGRRLRVEELGRETVFEGYYRLERIGLRFARFDGGMSAPVSREVFRSGDSVALLPYDPARDTVLLIEQFRPGPHAVGNPAWLLEIVAGRMEDGETPEGVARRETEEEAGLVPSEIVPVGGYYVSPGDSSQFVHVFCGRVDLQGRGEGFHGLAHENEDIRSVVMSADEALARLDGGGITASPAVVALNWLGRRRADLRARWGADAGSGPGSSGCRA